VKQDYNISSGWQAPFKAIADLPSIINTSDRGAISGQLARCGNHDLKPYPLFLHPAENIHGLPRN
jgi:hypothetical protein